MEQRKSTQELFNEITERLIIPLEECEKVCPTCKGLKLIYKQVNDEEGSVESCPDCYNGKHHICKYCGSSNKTNHCSCGESQKQRELEKDKIYLEKEQKLFEKAKKIKFNDYEGFIILDDSNIAQNVDCVFDWLYDKIKYDNLLDEELPKYLWGTKSESVLDLNLKDIISLQCEDDGYDDMYSYLDTNDEDLTKAQEHLDKWYKKQGDNVNIYYRDYTTAILLDEVIKQIKEDIEDFRLEDLF